MTDFWTRIAVAIPVILGIWTLFGKGMILGGLGDIFDRRLPELLQKPLYACAPCMSSVWGSAIWFYMGGSIEIPWIIFCLALCGILKIIAHNLL